MGGTGWNPIAEPDVVVVTEVGAAVVVVDGSLVVAGAVVVGAEVVGVEVAGVEVDEVVSGVVVDGDVDVGAESPEAVQAATSSIVMAATRKRVLMGTAYAHATRTLNPWRGRGARISP